MQNAKDTFYIALRDRLGLLNPLRTIVVRAVQRPGILMEEAEAPAAESTNDIFILRWSTFSGGLTNLVSLGCEIRYATSGTQAASSLDRGRSITEMDYEICSILQPMQSQKFNYAVFPNLMLQSQIFWSEPIFSELRVSRNQLSRSVVTQVFSLKEPGDL